MKIKSLLFAAMAAMLASCGGSGDGIKPASTSIQGEAGDYFTVVDKTYPSMDKEHHSVFLEFQRTDSVMPLAGSAYVNFSVDWLDKDGNVIDTSDYETLNDILTLKPGETKTKEVYVSEDVAKKITSFKVSGEMKYYDRVDNIVLDDKDDSEIYAEITSGKLSGTVGEYPVELEFSIAGNAVTGRYRYLQTGSGEWIPLVGTRVGKGMTLAEGAPGNQTGTMTLKFDYVSVPGNSMTVVGALNTTNGASYYVKLSGSAYWGDENSFDIEDFDSDYFDSSDSFSSSSTTSSSSSNVNIDSLLDQYEKAVNDAIACSKKMASGDYSAAAQMATASSKMLEAAKKLNDVTSQMNASQAERFVTIGTKAAQNVR